MTFDLSFIWAVIILVGVTVYIIADGFDLGVGILLPFVKDEASRDEFIDTISPVWDGNETWLVLGGAALMGAFPVAYSVILDAFMLPIIIMLFALILRGVAFEFRVHSPSGHKGLWTVAFVVGSYVTTFMQGMMAGAFLEGFSVSNVDSVIRFVGKGTDWISPFSILTGVSLVVMFALLASFWGAMKGHDTLRLQLESKYKGVIYLFLLVLVAIFVAMSLSGRLAPVLTGTRLYLVAGSMIVIALIVILLLFKSMRNGARFGLTMLSVVCGMIGYVSLFFPYIIPPSITLGMAASAGSSQMFGLVGTVILLPIIIAYLLWTYYIFRGKVSEGDGY
ncbi:cytochrome d ubiquinol oxidase subunit II [Ignatzschineria larvae DSM 13226]|uniref:Cytochrome d ubiquinol oxidase subunit II n=1 Tax=Ignatzschineria larvae DSM 13226 TaxID=1111732 RepID=A0ABZ3BYZ1_9GAMM|nr:cytochrome d ubiquinol oxidase subunit II [Ignatzschineria larvae]